MRLVKYIAHTGYCSRRKAGDLVKENAVTVNGHLVDDCSMEVENNFVIKVNSTIVSVPNVTEIWIYNKPPGCITSKLDPQERTIIYDLLPHKFKTMITIGRLDYNSQGLLLLTNNGDLANYLALPKNRIERKYIIDAYGRLDEARLQSLKSRKLINGKRYKVTEATIVSKNKSNLQICLTLPEGKNREVRNIFTHLDLRIKKLTRTNYGKFSLGSLPLNRIKRVDDKIVSEYTKLL